MPMISSDLHRELKKECLAVQKNLDELSITAPAFFADSTDWGDSQVRERVQSVLSKLGSHRPERLMDEWFGFGPLEPLIANDGINEILVNGEHSIWYEENGVLKEHPDCFLSATTFRNCFLRIAREAGVQTSLDNPFADGQWRNYRIHLGVSPLTSVSASLSLRRHPKHPWTLNALLAQNWCSVESMTAIKALIKDRKNFLLVGPTSSGKTSVLNACLQEIRPTERALLIEDTSEIAIPNAASLKLLARKDAQAQLRDVTLEELLRQSLRMRPDRIVMGEIRGPEAKDLLMAFATGHSGCMGTMHADSARQALLRLEMLVQLGASQWSLNAVRTLIFLSLQFIVVVRRSEKGERRLEGIYRIASLEEVGFLVEKIC